MAVVVVWPVTVVVPIGVRTWVVWTVKGVLDGDMVTAVGTTIVLVEVCVPV